MGDRQRVLSKRCGTAIRPTFPVFSSTGMRRSPGGERVSVGERSRRQCIAQMALMSLQLAPDLTPIRDLNKHFRRKHSAGAYYGQLRTFEAGLMERSGCR